MGFNLKRFAIIFFVFHIVPYAFVSFVKMDALCLLINTFGTQDGRFLYLLTLISILLFTAPIYLPIKNKKQP